MGIHQLDLGGGRKEKKRKEKKPLITQVLNDIQLKQLTLVSLNKISS